MRGYKFSVGMVAIVAVTAVAFATVPAEAQTATAEARQGPTRVATASRSPARVTVRKRSYLDPGTETKARAEHYHDYAHPPGNSAFQNSTVFNSGPGLPFMHNRMPFPNCFDMAGFCQ